ncbi:MAG TPA: ABC transporter permease [Patescibacteria group bacterium]|nr:ABC transporter permease [Patescibacteria group bacterium]
MEIIIPKQSQIYRSLLKADFLAKWRNRRAGAVTVLLPIIILIAWKQVVKQFGGPFALSMCITFGVVAVGLMGYSNTTARDRERGVFQRLRVTPASTWNIMTSRLTVELAQIAIMTVVAFAVGYYWDKIALSPLAYLFTLVIALICGMVYLGLGQAVVGLITSAETINSVSRFLYIAIILLGALGEFGVLGKVIGDIITWSPYGTVKEILNASMQPHIWNGQAWLALLITLVYGSLFAWIGIKWFKWNT